MNPPPGPIMQTADTIPNCAAADAASGTPSVLTPPAPDPADADQAQRLTTTEFCLVLLGALAVLGFMHWAEAFLVPFLLGILISYTFNPAVSALQRWYVPRALGAALMIGAVASAGAVLAYSLADDVIALTELVPQAASKVRAMARGNTGSRPLINLQKAATELERAASEATGGPTARPPQPAPVSSFSDRLKNWLLEQTSHAAQFLVQISTAFLIALFLLAAGDAFRRKVARLAGPSLARRRVAIEGLNEINKQIQRYMATTAATNALIAFATWAMLAAMSLQHAVFWGVAAGLLHIIPYVGSSITALAVGIVALVQFGSLLTAAAVAVGVLVIAALIGVLFNAWLQARACKVNTVTLLIGVLFFGWLWGGWGLILAVPMLTALKAIAERVAPWRPLAEFLCE